MKTYTGAVLLIVMELCKIELNITRLFHETGFKTYEPGFMAQNYAFQ